MSVENFEKALKFDIPIDINHVKPYFFAFYSLENNIFTRPYDIDGQQFLVKVEQKSKLARELSMRIESDETLRNTHIRELENRIRYELGLDDKMDVFIKMGREDYNFRRLLGKFPGFRLFANADIREAALLTVFSQYTNYVDFLNLTMNFYRKYGNRVSWNGNYYTFPDNEVFDKISQQNWKELKAYRQSKNLSYFNTEHFEMIETYTYYPIFKRGFQNLKKIQGIADYSARILMTYSARRYEMPLFSDHIKNIYRNKFLVELKSINRFDRWIKSIYPEQPALVQHLFMMEYYPSYMQHVNLFNLESYMNEEI